MTPSADEDDADNDDDNNNSSANNIQDTPVKSYPYLRDKKIIDMYKVFHQLYQKFSLSIHVEIYS